MEHQEWQSDLLVGLWRLGHGKLQVSTLPCRAARRRVKSETEEGPRSKVREEEAQQAAKEGRETGPRPRGLLSHQDRWLPVPLAATYPRAGLGCAPRTLTRAADRARNLQRETEALWVSGVKGHGSGLREISKVKLQGSRNQRSSYPAPCYQVRKLPWNEEWDGVGACV